MNKKKKKSTSSRSSKVIVMTCSIGFANKESYEIYKRKKASARKAAASPQLRALLDRNRSVKQ